jgi:UDP-2,3-diacylglucosamine pyrophosphatase LpxH
MLVFISDLHFIDGSAGSHNIKPKAFDYFFSDLRGIIDDKNNAIQEVIFVFLGDIFDLLRTTYWLTSPVNETPWGTPPQPDALKVHAETIFDDITRNPDIKSSLKKIRDEFAEIQQKVPKFEALYFPGNHDRLINQWDSLRKMVCDNLRLTQSPDPEFPHFKKFEDYGVFARHGHEFDFYNYEGGSGFSPADYLKVPIGDPITTELISRLPFEFKNRLDQSIYAQNLSEEERKRIVENFQEIDNVRPLGAVVEWLLYQVKDKPQWLIDIIEDTVDAVIRHFNGLDFVKTWFARHDKWLDPFDKADRIQIALYILEKFKVFSLEKLFSLAVKAGAVKLGDPLQDAAPDESALMDPKMHYVVYGHTHEPLLVPIRTRGDQGQLYLNTGTWRTRYQKSVRDNSFIGWKNMTYLIFYRDNERPGRQAEFETWTGSLKTV